MTSSIKSMNDVEDKMTKFINDSSNDEEYRSAVLIWLNDFSDAYYPYMFEIVKLLNDMDYDDDKFEYGELDEAGKKYVYECGEKFNEYGGFDYMNSMFYIMNNFMDCKFGVINEVKYIWNGIGDWKC